MSLDNIGILDPEGINLNPLTNEKYSEKYKELSQKWKKYPAYSDAKSIINSIKKHQVILVISSTGSGKTVLIPKYTLHAFNYDAKIAVTLPKQLIAKSAAEFAALTLDVELGTIVGYKYKGSDKKFYNNKNKLLYATDGTIVSQILQDPLLSKYNSIIIDEAHERKIQIDFLLYLLRNVVLSRKDFKLIIMSATVDKKIFENYFKEIDFKIIDVGGKRGFPIESIFLDTPSNLKYLEKGFEIINNIISKKEEGDIIFFVPSVKETFEICKKFDIQSENFCIEVYAGMDNEKQIIAQDKDIYKSNNNKSRKIVIATNVAESSLTIDGLVYVIDSGYEISEYFDPSIGSRILEKKLISKAQVNQRMGRTGRTSKGICYHLYTKNEFDNMVEYPEPSIRTSNIYSECLKLLNLPMINSVDNLEKVLNNFIEPPDSKYVKYSINILLRLGLIDGEKLTELGKIIGNLELTPEESLSVYASYQLFCFSEVVGIISVIESLKGNISDLFIKINPDSKELTSKLKTVKKNLCSSNSDHLTLLKIFITYSKYRKEKKIDELNKWLYSNFLKKDSLIKAYDYYKRIIYKIKDDVRKLELKKLDSINDYNLKDRILACFVYGFKTNYAYLNRNNKYTTMLAENVSVGNDSFVTGNKKEIVYDNLLTMSGRTNVLIISYVNNKINEIVKKYF